MHLELIQVLDVSCSSFMFTLPKAFYPDYSEHIYPKDREITRYPYKFWMVIQIQSVSPITYVSHPRNCEHRVFNRQPMKDLEVMNNRIQMTCSGPSELIRLYYRCNSMLEQP